MIRLRDLVVKAGTSCLVQGASLDLHPGELVALVGASGSGKTMTARAILGITTVRPGVVGGSLEVTTDAGVVQPFQTGWQQLHGPVLGYLPQDARGGLDPLWRIGTLVSECLLLAGADPDPRPPLRRAGFADPARVEGLFAHELSGGMAQRASVACALARGSRYLIADEPTTGLDPTVQEAILGELRALAQGGVGVLLITHDLRVVRRHADRVLVMHEGDIIEGCEARDLGALASPAARALLESTARVAGGSLG